MGHMSVTLIGVPKGAKSGNMSLPSYGGYLQRASANCSVRCGISLAQDG